MKKISICAIITVRNEFQYLKFLLPFLAEQNIDVIIIDNDSTDESKILYASHKNNSIIKLESLPYRGYFSLTAGLEKKQNIIKDLSHDWIIHHDADEILEHHKPGYTLRDAIEEAEEQGYNVLNFNEIVFLPEPATDYTKKNYYKEMLRYYFFEPAKNRLNRAWKRKSKLENTDFGGHKLEGNKLNIFPQNHNLRHYITLSGEHARRKYLHLRFSPEDLNKKWHSNRMNFTKTNLKLPTKNNHLHYLENYASKDFNLKYPTSKHFWEWK